MHILNQHPVRQYSFVDQLLIQAELGLTQAFGPKHSTRPRPAAELPETTLHAEERTHTAGLMRVNHTGEVCAQALYFGQALLAKNPAVSAQLQHAALEEVDHLYWCEARIQELGSHTSLLNPLWYTVSVLIGLYASFRGDAYSLGFIHATEAQVEEHLSRHLSQIPAHDHKTRDIVEQMKTDEAEHGTQALEAGGACFDEKTQDRMRQVSSVMTTLSYHI